MEPDESAPFGAQMTSPGAISGRGLTSACRRPVVGGEMQSGFRGNPGPEEKNVVFS